MALGFSPCSLGPVALHPWKPRTSPRAHGRGDLRTSWHLGNKESGPRGHLQGDLPLGLASAHFHHLPVALQAGHQDFSPGVFGVTPDLTDRVFWAKKEGGGRRECLGSSGLCCNPGTGKQRGTAGAGARPGFEVTPHRSSPLTGGNSRQPQILGATGQRWEAPAHL